MKVIAINGSPRINGNTSIALGWMSEELETEGVEVETIRLGDKAIQGCIACERCAASEENFCVLKDDGINDLIVKLREADGFIIGSPTYFGGMNGTLKSALDRIFYAGRRNGGYRNKVGAAASTVRRGGGVETFNQIVTYFHLAEMIIAPSQAWVMGFSRNKGEIHQDCEGRQAIRRHANAMAWILKMKEATKDSIPLPRTEERNWMSFIR